MRDKWLQEKDFSSIRDTKEFKEIIEDETGIIFLDYAQPLNIWNGLFGLLKAGKYIDKEVEVRGWYRRAPIPYIEIKEMNVEGKNVKCYSYITQIVLSVILIM